MRKSLAAVALVAATTLAAVGLAPAASAADGVAVAKSIVAKYSKNPTTVGNLPAITKPVPKGKYIITIASNTPSGQDLTSNMVIAGKILGWKVEAVNVQASLENYRTALAGAIAKRPDGIAVSGLESETYGDQYREAASKGIAVICSACMSRPGGGLLDTHIAGPKMLDLWGQMIAAFTVANVKGTPNVQMFGLSIYPILLRFDTAYQNFLKRLDPASKIKFNELDFKNGVPAQVANVYKANPGTNFITADQGDFLIGVTPALFQAGAVPGQKPLIGGLSAGQGSVQNLRDKTMNAWTGYSLPIVGFSVIDSFARYFTKTPFAKSDLPTQILTQKNINSAVLTPTGTYLGVKDYQAQFKKIWGVK